jgi:hypothetical protein
MDTASSSACLFRNASWFFQRAIAENFGGATLTLDRELR